MKVRLTQSGFESYTGQMGVMFFEDGLSTTDVSLNDAIRLSAVMSASWENGDSISIAQRLIDEADTPAPVMRQIGDEGGEVTIEIPEGEESEVEEVVAEQTAAVEVASEAVEQSAKVVYTAEELAAIADKEGINGLRAIAEPHGIKNNSIRGLIDAIVKAGIAKE